MRLTVEEAAKFMGLSRPFQQHVTRRQYLKLAMKFHPDRPGGSKQRFQRLESAMAVMRDVSGGAPSRTDDSSSDSDDDDRESDPDDERMRAYELPEAF